MNHHSIATIVSKALDARRAIFATVMFEIRSDLQDLADFADDRNTSNVSVDVISYEDSAFDIGGKCDDHINLGESRNVTFSIKPLYLGVNACDGPNPTMPLRALDIIVPVQTMLDARRHQRGQGTKLGSDAIKVTAAAIAEIVGQIEGATGNRDVGCMPRNGQANHPDLLQIAMKFDRKQAAAVTSQPGPERACAGRTSATRGFSPAVAQRGDFMGSHNSHGHVSMSKMREFLPHKGYSRWANASRAM